MSWDETRRDLLQKQMVGRGTRSSSIYGNNLSAASNTSQIIPSNQTDQSHVRIRNKNAQRQLCFVCVCVCVSIVLRRKLWKRREGAYTSPTERRAYRLVVCGEKPNAAASWQGFVKFTPPPTIAREVIRRKASISDHLHRHHRLLFFFSSSSIFRDGWKYYNSTRLGHKMRWDKQRKREKKNPQFDQRQQRQTTNILLFNCLVLAVHQGKSS